MYGMGTSHLQCGDMDTYISMFGQVVQIKIEYHYKDLLFRTKCKRVNGLGTRLINVLR